MGLFNPGALYFLALVPVLVVAYLARERPQRVIVSSVLALRALHLMRGERFGGRPRFNWTFFLELLILMLAVLAMTGPYLIRTGYPIAIVLDDSAPMQARTPAGGSRFDAAVGKIKAFLGTQGGSTAVTVYLTAPQAHPLATFTNPGSAAAAIAQLRPLDAPANTTVFASLLTQLAADHHLARIVVASYRALASPMPPRITTILLGDALPNYAIGALALSREALGTSTLRARVTVANFSGAPQTLKVSISADGRPAANAQASVEAGAIANLDLPGLPAARAYRAELIPADAFPLDNVAFATATAVKAVSILFVSPVVADAESLKLIPGVALTTRTPEAYTPADLSANDVAIFEYTIPKQLPALNALFVMPPPGDPVLGFATEAARQLQLTGWPTTDPLTDGVNFRLLNLHTGEYLGQHQWMQAIVTGADGGLVLSGERQGRSYLATGFNPFPYLGKQNLPMSILTLNLLSHLAGLGAQTGDLRTGQPWTVPAGVTRIALPSGAHRGVTPGQSFAETSAQGLYELTGPSGTSYRAVNLADLTTSDLEHVATLKIESSASGSAPANAAVTTALAPWLLMAIIALIALEALLVYRRRGPSLAASL